jgi:alpha-tubulin suppressor-like RCC1 family protein
MVKVQSASCLQSTVVPGLNGVVAVATGSTHSLALSRDGTAMACGLNECGQLGLGDTDDRDTFTVVAGLRGVVDIDVGQYHAIAATAEGGLYTWGMGMGDGSRRGSHNTAHSSY